MAIRYLCVISTDPNAPLSSATTHLADDQVVALETSQICLVTDSIKSVVPLPDQRGAIVGHVFTKGARPTRVATMDGAAARTVADSLGQSLMETYWGGYVAFVQDPAGFGISVLRDPSGAIPCYYIDLGDRVVVSSDIDTLYDAGYLEPEIDDTYLQHHLICYDLRTPKTGLTGVKELLAGHSLIVGQNRLDVKAVWSPWDHVTSTPASNAEQAEHLFETVTTTIGAWGSVFRHPLLGVSGGLDSSIVAAALCANRSKVTCYTMATDDAEGDERSYARILTEALSITLEERFYDLDEVDFFRSTAAHLPRPLLHAFGQSDFKAKRSIGSQHGADAFYTGIGGDNVFCSLTSTLPILDRVHSEGLGPGAWSTLNDVCRIAGCSVWQALDNVLRRSRRMPYRYHWRHDFTFLPPEVAKAFIEPSHPWLNAPQGSLPGKTLHVAMLARIQGTIDGYERRHTPPLINPLLSQPIVEACLAIPTWRWLEHGCNRSVARQAFGNSLPVQIIERRSKGGPSRFANSVINHNRAALADRLEGGHLAERGLIDLNSALGQLRSERPLRDVDYDRFATLAEIEAWVAHWRSRRSEQPSQPDASGLRSARKARQRTY